LHGKCRWLTCKPEAAYFPCVVMAKCVSAHASQCQVNGVLHWATNFEPQTFATVAQLDNARRIFGDLWRRAQHEEHQAGIVNILALHLRCSDPNTTPLLKYVAPDRSSAAWGALESVDKVLHICRQWALLDKCGTTFPSHRSLAVGVTEFFARLVYTNRADSREIEQIAPTLCAFLRRRQDVLFSRVIGEAGHIANRIVAGDNTGTAAADADASEKATTAVAECALELFPRAGVHHGSCASCRDRRGVVGRLIDTATAANGNALGVEMERLAISG
jgi:sulfur relay (sulfurtransferase) complex TusBCD TusD component (DsrE family)